MAFVFDLTPRADVKVSTEDKHLEHVPGTDLLSDRQIVQGNVIEINEASQLKRGVGRYAHVVLIPQPSDDPNDPYVIVSSDHSYKSQLTRFSPQLKLALVAERSMLLDFVSTGHSNFTKCS